MSASGHRVAQLPACPIIHENKATGVRSNPALQQTSKKLRAAELFVKGHRMIRSITEFIAAIQGDLNNWNAGTKPWFRGESGDESPLCPKIATHSKHEENHLLQSFRRQAGGLANVPLRKYTDMWLFLAQHYGVPTRLLDWTEGALHALYFAINRDNFHPRVYMLNPRKLNDLAGSKTYPPNYPLSWFTGGGLYVALAWQNRKLNAAQKELRDRIGLNIAIPIAFPATYQDQRMIAQRSCFTIHGRALKSLQDILIKNNIDLADCLVEYKIDLQDRSALLKELSILGVSAATLFPDLDHLASDLVTDIDGL
jgi:hypothetical protein